jgi:hypothetical protein
MWGEDLGSTRAQPTLSQHCRTTVFLVAIGSGGGRGNLPEVYAADQVVGAAVENVQECDEDVKVEAFGFLRRQAIHLADGEVDSTVVEEGHKFGGAEDPSAGHDFPKTPFIRNEVHGYFSF